MPTPPLSDEEAIRGYNLVQEHGSPHAAALAIGHDSKYIKRRMDAAIDRGLINNNDNIEYPDNILSDGLDGKPIDEILDGIRSSFNRGVQKANNERWFKIKVKETKPYGVLFFGDPHIGNPGCNFPLLEKHIKVAQQQGIYSVNIGDTTDNWVGRLVRKYADSETTKADERKLIEWFMHDCGITWLAWILGNHDLWNDGEAFHKLIGKGKFPIIKWKSKFSLVHPNKTKINIDAAHGRKGHSMWNEMHATLKAAKMGELADIYVSGHIHSFGLQDLEIPERGTNTWLMQLRGYKYNDDYALVGNFPEYQRGSSILAIIDPSKDPRRSVPMCFEDVEHGGDYLKHLRKKAK